MDGSSRKGIPNPCKICIMIKKRLFVTSLCLMSFIGLMAQTLNVASPDGKLQVNIVCQNGQACYSVNYDGKSMVTPSALGLKADIGDFTKQTSWT